MTMAPMHLLLLFSCIETLSYMCSRAFLRFSKTTSEETYPYTSSYNLTPPISLALIGTHLLFCSETSSTAVIRLKNIRQLNRRRGKLENSPKRMGGKKTANNVNDGIIATNIDKNLELHLGKKLFAA